MRDFPVLDSAPTSVVEPMVEAIAESFAEPAVESDGLAIDERMRLEALLDELLGLKARIQATKEPK
jgi:hypothetical protein